MRGLAQRRGRIILQQIPEPRRAYWLDPHTDLRFRHLSGEFLSKMTCQGGAGLPGLHKRPMEMRASAPEVLALVSS